MSAAQENHGASVRVAIVGVTLALGLPVARLLLAKLGIASATPGGKEMIWWGIALILLFWAVRIESLTFAALGFKRPGWRTFGWGVLGGVVLILLIVVCYTLLFPALGIKSDPNALKSFVSQPVWMIFLISIRAAFVEELLFRFYPISQLTWLTGNKWLASFIPGIFFVGMHAPSWGLVHLIPVTLGAVVLTLLYWRQRDFWCSAFAHFLADFIPFGMAAMAPHH